MTTLYTEYDQYSASTITVTTSAELNDAIEHLGSTTGGTILVDGNGGPYDINVDDVGSTDTPVLIKALNTDEPPTVHSINVLDSSSITITEMRVDSSEVYDVRADWITDIRVTGSDNIALVNNDMSSVAEGTIGLDDDAIPAEGLGVVRESEDFTFSHNTVADYYQGLSFLETDGIVFSDNEIYGLQGDGFRAGGVQNVVIANNYMHDFQGTTQDVNHSDMIQFWGTATESLTQNVKIYGNVLDSGSGVGTQGIFIRNEAFGSSGVTGGHFENIVIYDNILHNSASQGISVSDTKGVEIYDNTVLWNESSYLYSTAGGTVSNTVPAIRTMNSLDVTIDDNITGRLDTDSTNDVSNNIILSFSDPTSENYAYHHFVNLEGTGDSDIRDLRLRHDSELNGNYGAEKSWATASEGVEVSVSADTVAGNNQELNFSAEYSLIDGAPIDVDTSTFEWLFSDGSTKEGASINAIFENPGLQEVVLKVTTADGTVQTIGKTFDIKSNDIASLTFDGKAVDTSDTSAVVETSNVSSSDYVTSADGKGLKIDGVNEVEIVRSNDQLFNLETFSISLDIKASDLADGGSLLSMKNHFSLKVSDDGSAQFVLVTDQGVFDVSTSPDALSDGGWHTLGVSYNHYADALEIYVDGTMEGQTVANGITGSSSHEGIVIGGSRAKDLTAVIDNLEIGREPIGGWSSEGGDTVTDPVDDTPDVSDPVSGEDGPIGPVDPDPDQGATDPDPVVPDPDPVVDDSNGGAGDGGTGTLLHASEDGASYDLGDGDVYFLGRDNDFLYGRDNFRIELDLETDQEYVDGVFLHLQGTMRGEIDEQGHIRFTLVTSDGVHELRTEQAVFDEAGQHELAFNFDSEEGLVQIEVDGEIMAQGDASGTTPAESYYGLQIGNTFGEAADATASNFEYYADPDLTPQAASEPTPVADSEWTVDNFFGFEGAIYDEVDPSTELRFWSKQGAEYTDGVDGQAYHMDGKSKIGFERGEIELNGSEGFNLSFDFQRTDLEEGGRIMHLHKVMDTYIDDDGFLHFELKTDDGTHHLVNDIEAFDDEDWHNIEISYDGADGMLSLAVDDSEAILDGVTGATEDALYWGLTIGSTWGTSIEGNIDNFAYGDEPVEDVNDGLLIA